MISNYKPYVHFILQREKRDPALKISVSEQVFFFESNINLFIIEIQVFP